MLYEVITMENGDDRAKTAVDVFCYRITKFIGAYAAAMGGVDAILFTAGIGENNGFIREMCVSSLGFLGAALDQERRNNFV